MSFHFTFWHYLQGSWHYLSAVECTFATEWFRLLVDSPTFVAFVTQSLTSVVLANDKAPLVNVMISKIPTSSTKKQQPISPPSPTTTKKKNNPQATAKLWKRPVEKRNPNSPIVSRQHYHHGRDSVPRPAGQQLSTITSIDHRRGPANRLLTGLVTHPHAWYTSRTASVVDVGYAEAVYNLYSSCVYCGDGKECEQHGVYLLCCLPFL